jgi:hypothetical protein
MKNKLLPLIFVLGGYSAYSQVGIGTPMPNASAQLEVVSTNKGVLIPRVALTGTADSTTITNGNVNSLLVFNTVTIADVKPGYYYWYGSKWNRIAMSEESVGMAGGEGAPGTPGVTIPGDATIYVDKATGTIYVLEPGSNPANWIPISGASGNNGKDGMTGGNGAPGTPGVNIPADATIYIDNTTGIVYILKPGSDPKEWITLNGNSGKDGLPGGDGAPGTPGITIPADATIYVDNTTGIVYVAKPGTDPKEWIALNNNNGKDGLPGGDGAPGTPGITIPADATIYVDNTTGIVYVAKPGSDPKEWIALNNNNGKDGLPGGDGAPGTPGVTIPADATIYVDKTTGTVYILEPGSSPANWIAVNGKDGLPGGEGAPGTPGVTIPADAVIYIDKTTGIIYVRDPEDSTKWVQLNGAAGNNGKDGMIGGDGAPGTPGVTIPADATIYIDNTTGVVYILKPGSEPKEWISLNGNNGKDGLPGGDGAPGTPGVTIPADATIYVDKTTGIVYVLEPGSSPANWIALNGNNGKDGLPGGDGAPGTPGVTIPADATIYVDKTTGTVYILEPGSSPANWIAVNGKDGLPGGDGAPGTPGVTIPADALIYIDKTTGIIYVRDPEDSTKWVQLNGAAGNNGKDGMTGGDGAPGTPGVTIPADATVYVDNTTGVVYLLKPGSDPKEWIALNGNSGKDGLPGGDGAPGTPGVTIPADATIYVDNTTGIVYVAKPGSDPKEWIALNNNNGKDGLPGGDGAPGTPGVTIPADATIYIDNTTGIVYVAKPGSDPKEWIAINGNNGKDGLPGGDGAPGTPGVTIPADATIYVDKTTGIVYVLEPGSSPENWIAINANSGKDGLPGGNGAPGTPGVTIPADATIYVDKTTGTVYVLEPGSSPANWIAVNGKDGLPGGDGAPGTPGVTIPAEAVIYVDKTTGIIYVRDPKDPAKWIPINGAAGNNGKDGMVGGTGAPGTQGSNVTADSTVYVDSATGMVYILKPGADPLKPESWLPVNVLTSLAINGATGNLEYKDEKGAITSLDIAKASKEPWFKVDENVGATSNDDNIYTKGWVGIGFDKPSEAANEKLRVNGAITTVNSYYADYVFEDYFKGFSTIKEDYKFKSLKDVEKYINTHKHLPGITPINELEKTKVGYSFNMSELAIQLLEKTEELYLHVIEQNNAIIQKDKEIEKMNQRLEKLEKLIDANINSSNLAPLSSK